MNTGLRKFTSQLYAANDRKDDVSIRLGTVESVNSTTVDISLGGATITEVNRLAEYSPVVGDRVLIVRSGAGLVVVGKVAS
jgi:hypothetical protein